jgi:hypothetical protein
MNDKAKRYLISAGLSFVTGFALVMVTEIDNVTLESFRDGTLVAVVFAAVRSGLKALLELYLTKENG